MLSFHTLDVKVADSEREFVLCTLLVPQTYNQEWTHRCVTLIHSMSNTFRSAQNVDSTWGMFLDGLPFVRFNQFLYHERETTETRTSTGITTMYVGDTKIDCCEYDAITAVSTICQAIMKVYANAL